MPGLGVSSSRRRPLQRTLAFVATVLFTIVVVAAPASGDVSFINGRRSGAGLAPVGSSGALASVARAHSVAMAARSVLGHSSNLRAAVSEVLPAWQAVAENVGVGHSVAEVNAQFVASATHRANIFGNFNLAGVGVVTGDDGRVWVTQVFARVASSTATTTAVVTSTTSRAAAPRVAPAPARVIQPRVSRARPVSEAPPRSDPVVAPPKPPAAVAGMATPNGGYQLVAADGGVFSFGDAAFAGSGVQIGLSEPVVGGANNSTGDGYVLFGRRGGVFTFGSAGFHGSGAELPLRGSVVGGAMSPSGRGYTLFADDGGVLAFGDAAFHGSAIDQALSAPVVGGAVTPAGNGYWLVGADGGVYAFGDAPFAGSAADQPLPDAVKAVVAGRSGRGYWLVLGDREVMAYGDLSVPERRRPTAGPAVRLI